MRAIRTLALTVGISLIGVTIASAQARLVIENQSQRQMAVKVMGTTAEDWLHATTSVQPYGSQTIYFSQTGTFFLKTMALLAGRDTIFQKGEAFQVYVGPRGYSVLTMTFSIVESNVPQVLGGKQISEQEFERDRVHR